MTPPSTRTPSWTWPRCAGGPATCPAPGWPRTPTSAPAVVAALASLIAAEAAGAAGHALEARRLAATALRLVPGSLDPLFAGMPRGSFWPTDHTLPGEHAGAFFSPESFGPTEAARPVVATSMVETTAADELDGVLAENETSTGPGLWADHEVSDPIASPGGARRRPSHRPRHRSTPAITTPPRPSSRTCCATARTSRRRSWLRSTPMVAARRPLTRPTRLTRPTQRPTQRSDDHDDGPTWTARPARLHGPSAASASGRAITPHRNDRDRTHPRPRQARRRPASARRPDPGPLRGARPEAHRPEARPRLARARRAALRRPRERPFFGSLVDFITSGPLVALALEGPNAIAVVRAINGATRPHEAAPGTIRGDFALETAQNIVHASDGPETASTELALWFSDAELLDYEREVDRWVLPPAE